MKNQTLEANKAMQATPNGAPDCWRYVREMDSKKIG
jgi:hypothetical protein